MPTNTGTLANDILEPLNNGDIIYGLEGDDIYIYDGTKKFEIRESHLSADIDTLEFSAGINFQDLIIVPISSGDIEIRNSSVWTSAIDIVIDGDPGQTVGVEKINFLDGNEYTISNVNTITSTDDDEILYVAKGAYDFNAGDGDDIIHGTSDITMLGGYGANDRLFGGAGNDTIYGYDGYDELYGGAGDDYLDGGSGDSTNLLYGEDGDDILVGGASQISGGVLDVLDGGDGNDQIYMGEHGAKVYGGGGSDEIHVNAENIPLIADISGSVLRGGADNDVYIFDYNAMAGTISYQVNIIDDSGDYDTMVLNRDFHYSAMLIEALPIQVTFSGFGVSNNQNYYMAQINQNFTGNQIERFTFSDGTIYTLNYSTNLFSQVSATNGDDTIYLTAWHDDFHALGGNDTIYALERDDIVDGGAGNDTLYGEHGNDTLIGGSGTDVLDGGIGVDTADYSNASSGIDVTLSGGVVTDDGDGATDTLVGIENITGSQFADDIHLDNISNVVNGNDGNDIIYAYNGADTINGGAGRDYINAGDGDDIVDGGDGRDTIYAGQGNDILYGGADVDKLYGGAGDNTLNGGDGIDLLYSGSGADRFVLENLSHLQGGSVYDRVYNFDETEGDLIDISDLVSGYNAGTDDINDFVVLLEYGNDMLLRVDGDGTGSSIGETNVARLYGYNGWDGLSVQNVIDNGQLIV